VLDLLNHLLERRLQHLRVDLQQFQQAVFQLRNRVVFQQDNQQSNHLELRRHNLQVDLLVDLLLSLHGCQPLNRVRGLRGSHRADHPVLQQENLPAHQRVIRQLYHLANLLANPVLYHLANQQEFRPCNRLRDLLHYHLGNLHSDLRLNPAVNPQQFLRQFLRRFLHLALQRVHLLVNHRVNPRENLLQSLQAPQQVNPQVNQRPVHHYQNSGAIHLQDILLRYLAPLLPVSPLYSLVLV
jgi:predicted metalloenzyme YecM